MSRLKNGESLKGTFSKWVKSTGLVFSTTLLMMTGTVGSASAAGYCCDPCAPVDCCDMPDYVLYADFIYWQTHLDGLEYAQSGVNETLSQASLTSQGKVYQPHCKWYPGFRVGGMVDLGCCDWDLYAQYTWLHPDQTDRVGSVSGLIAKGVNFNDNSLLTGAQAKYDVHFNVLDFGLGRTFNVNECFLFRPHFGFKATWQEHKYNVTLLSQDSPTTPLQNIVQTSTNKTRFDGIGLRGGFDAAWKFSPCFSIVGNFAMSGVWSDLELARQEIFVESPISGGQATTDVVIWTKQSHCVIVPVLELFLGIRWDSTVCECYDMFVKIGWENQVWFDMNRFIRVSPETHGPHGNLTFQGLVVGAGMGF